MRMLNTTPLALISVEAFYRDVSLKARVYREKYPVFERTLSPSCLGRMTILRKESSLTGLLG